MEIDVREKLVQQSSSTSADGGDHQETFTADEAIEKSGFGRFQVLLLLYTGMAWLCDAMEMILLSFIGPAARCFWHLSAFQEGAISSAVFIGVFLGAYCWGVLADYKGRRFGFFATAVFTFAFGLVSALSPYFWVLLLARSLVGFGLGGASVIFSLFMEFIPSASRGFWLVSVEFFWTVGSVLEALLAWAILPTLQFRWLLGISALPFAVLLVAYPWLPESPRYLMVKGDTRGALAVLERMAHTNKKELPPGHLVPTAHVKELPRESTAKSALVTASPTGQSRRGGWEQLAPKSGQKCLGDEPLGTLKALLSPALRKTTLLLWLVNLANAFVYYGLVLLTTQLTLKKSGINAPQGCTSGNTVIKCNEQGLPIVHSSTYKEVLITSFAEFPGLLIAAFVVDHLGRKRSLGLFLAACSLCLVPLFAPLSGWLTTGLLFGARASIMGSFSILWAYAPELYPTTVRSTGLGLANSFARVGGFLCPFVAVYLVAACQRALAVALFALVTFAAAFATTLFPHDTKGRALEDSLPEPLEPHDTSPTCATTSVGA